MGLVVDGADADDLLQDTMLRCWAARASFAGSTASCGTATARRFAEPSTSCCKAAKRIFAAPFPKSEHSRATWIFAGLALLSLAFAFGTGSAVNRSFLFEFGQAGRGRTEFVTLDEDPAAAVDRSKF